MRVELFAGIAAGKITPAGTANEQCVAGQHPVFYEEADAVGGVAGSVENF